MADFSDLFANKKGLAEAHVTGLRGLAAAVGVVANLTSIVGIASAVMSALQILGLTEDKTQEQLAFIAEKVQAILQFEHAEDVVVQMRQVITVLEPARARLRTLLARGPD